ANRRKQAVRGGDRIADLVGDRRRQLVEARLLLGLHGRLLALQLALDGGIEVARLQGTRAEHAHPVRAEPEAPADRGPEKPGVPGGHQVDEREQRDDAEVGREMAVEAHLRRRPRAGAREDLLLLAAWLLGRSTGCLVPAPALLPPAIALRVALHPLRPFPVPVGVLVPVALRLLGPLVVPVRALLSPAGGPVVPAAVSGLSQHLAPRSAQLLLEVAEKHEREDASEEDHSRVPPAWRATSVPSAVGPSYGVPPSSGAAFVLQPPVGAQPPGCSADIPVHVSGERAM